MFYTVLTICKDDWRQELQDKERLSSLLLHTDKFTLKSIILLKRNKKRALSKEEKKINVAI